MVQKNLKLTIELVPSSSWQNNLRGILKPSMWKNIRGRVLQTFDNRCAICKRNSKKLHVHEVWEYDDENHIQTLKDILPLCYMCHSVKHIGFTSLQASKTGVDLEKFIKYFMSINKVDRGSYQQHLNEQLKKFEERGKYEWQLDLKKLKDFEK